MADESDEQSWRSILLALAALATLGWLATAFVWWQGTQAQSYLNERLGAAERARESLASDLQNLEKSAGAAAELKKQAADAEKALTDASTARASAQNELADLTKQISDAKTRHLRGPGRGKRQDARFAGRRQPSQGRKRPRSRAAEPGPGPLGGTDPFAGRRRRRAQGSRGCSGPGGVRPEAVRGVARPNQFGGRRAQRPSSANSRSEASNGNRARIRDEVPRL